MVTPPTEDLLAAAGDFWTNVSSEAAPVPIHLPGMEPQILEAQPAAKQARREYSDAQ